MFDLLNLCMQLALPTKKSFVDSLLLAQPAHWARLSATDVFPRHNICRRPMEEPAYLRSD